MRLSRVLSIALITSASLFAADLSGTWTGLIPARNNDMQDITFRLTQKGDVLNGKLYRDTTSVPILDGKITGDQISFRVESEEQVGNVFVVMKYSFTGSIKGSDIELTREREANPELNSGNPANRPNQKPTFTLKRIL
jgi:hypothetical protein